MNMHVRTERLKVEHGKSYRGKSGAVHRVTDNSGNPSWPFKTADTEHSICRFWQADGSGYNTDAWNTHATVGDDLVAEVPKFAVGDKVRVATMEWGDAQHGKTGTVTSNDPDKFSDLTVTIKYDEPLGCLKTNSYSESQLELIPTNHTSCAAAEVDNLADEYGAASKLVEASEAKVREPGYRFTAKYKPQPGDRVSIGDNGTFTVKEVKGDVVHFCDRPRDLTWLLHTNASVSDCTLVQAATASLTIKAGRYYKTRDGRKVGPMTWRNAGTKEFPWEGDIPGGCHEGCKTGFIFRLDGTNYEHTNLDIIAEWSDASEGFPLRGVSPVVAPATTAEPDSKLLVTISADTSALDAEIDRVKRRLKKLAKRARKLGIDLEFSDLRDAA